jgi:hypothetical protein
LIVVAANSEWKNTGMLIEGGEILQITHVSGKWHTEPGAPWINGFECTGECGDCLLPTAPEGSLIARVGDGDALCVGSSPFVSKNAGFLYLSFNDASGWWFDDNEGSLTVQVETAKP